VATVDRKLCSLLLTLPVALTLALPTMAAEGEVPAPAAEETPVVPPEAVGEVVICPPETDGPEMIPLVEATPAPVETAAPVETPAPAPSEAQAADPSRVDVAIDGVVSATCVGKLEGWTTYVSFTPTALALRPDLTLTWEEGVFVARGEGVHMTARNGDLYLQINGRYLYIPGGVKAGEDGSAWLPVRTMAAALGAQVAWQNGRVELTTGGSPMTWEGRPYTDADLDLVARVITHESGYQPFLGQIAVGNVIVNRVKSPAFPATVSEVVYQRGQFPHATDYAPTDQAILAAKLALEGAQVVPGAYWFNGAGKPCWASRNKALIATIGGHSFYG